MEKCRIEVNIRRLAPGDAAALAAFYNGLSKRSRRTFRPLGWTTTVETCAGIVRDNQLEGSEKYDLVAVCGERIVGWSFVWNVHSDEPVFGLGIADAYHGKGLGSALMDRILEAAQGLGVPQLYLTVVQDNQVAWQMYERRGFRRYGELVAEDGLAYYQMALTLSHRNVGCAKREAVGIERDEVRTQF